MTGADFRRWKALFVPVEKLMSWDYVRETTLHISTPYTLARRKRPMFGYQHGGIIGFATISRPDRHAYLCLIWWLKTYDRPVDPNGTYRMPEQFQGKPEYKAWGPCEAVAPARVMSFFPELGVQP